MKNYGQDYNITINNWGVISFQSLSVCRLTASVIEPPISHRTIDNA